MTGVQTEAEALLDCECGHSLDTHNGLGCYERLSYEPLVTCECRLTDDRTHAELLAARLPGHDRRIQAEALRAAAADDVSGWALRSWLNHRADEIEGPTS